MAEVESDSETFTPGTKTPHKPGILALVIGHKLRQVRRLSFSLTSLTTSRGRQSLNNARRLAFDAKCFFPCAG